MWGVLSLAPVFIGSEINLALRHQTPKVSFLLRSVRCRMNRLSAVLICSAFFAMSASAWPSPANTQERPPPPDTTRPIEKNGTGLSYWGEIPSADQSPPETIQNRPMPMWEGMLVWPYRVITFPLKLVSSGVGESLQFLDERKVIERIGGFLGPRQGPFGVLMQFQAGGLSGFGGGVALEHDAFLSPSNRFRLHATTTLNGTHRAGLGLRFSTGATGELDVGAGYRVRPNARFFGIGPTAVNSEQSFYTQQLAWAGTSYRQGLGRNFYLGGDVLFSSVDAQLPQEDDDPPIDLVFAGALPVGYGSTSHGVTVGAAFSHINVSETGRPTTGGSRRFRATYFSGLGHDSAAFWTYRVDLQQFLQLWYPYHVVAIRTHLSWIDQAGSAPLPFQRMMTNDDPDLMRGFRDFRWRDRGLAVLSAEYRWPLWVLTHPDAMGLDLYLHTDVGQVFSNIDQINGDNLTFSYGAGVRLLGARGFVLRIEYARSNEANVWRLRGDQIFQFTRGGFFYGRDPIPAR